MSTWIESINYVMNGEYVKGEVVNRPLSALAERTQYLYDLVRSLSAGQALILPNVPLSPSTIPGAPVYYDDVEDRFDNALAEVSLTDTNYGYPTEKAYVRGVVGVKHTTNTGDVIIGGYLQQTVWDIDWDSVSETGTALVGDVNVSPTTAGRLTTTQSHLTVRVGHLDGAGNLVLGIDVDGNLREHIHFKFTLTQNLGALITDEGWLAAAVFTGNGIAVPAGYTHGYNVATDDALSPHFPPVPVVAHSLFVDGALGAEGPDYLVDENGIWWKGSDTPWSKDTYFYTVELATDSTVLTSAQSSTTSIPVSVLDSEGNPSQTGDVRLGVLPSDLVGGTVVDHPTVVGDVADPGTGRAKKVAVVNRLVAGANCWLEGVQGDAIAGYYGKVLVHVGATAGSQLVPTVAELNNTVETKFGPFAVIAFPAGRANAAVIYSISIPTNLLPDRSISIALDLVAGSVVGDSLNVAYALARPGEPVPSGWNALTSMGPAVDTANTPKRLATDSVDCQPGDVVIFSFTQPASAAYELAILRAMAIIVSKA